MVSVKQHILLALCGLLLYTTSTTALPERRHVPSSLIPDNLPPKPTNGLCYKYCVQAEDTCQSVGEAFHVTVAEINSYNWGNYGFKGCPHIQQGEFICLSPGAPPMPEAFPQATCGPRVPGTARPFDYSSLSSLNPCPEGQCCTAEGKCSTDSNTCTSDECISGCGDKPPSPSDPQSTGEAAAPPKTTTTLHLTQITSTTTTFTVTPTTSSSTSEAPPAPPAPAITTDPTKTTNPETQTAPTETAAWTMAAYFGGECDGDYFLVQGHHGADGDCLDLRSLSSEYTATGVWCRYYTEGGFKSTSCDAIPEAMVFSWSVTGGECMAFKDGCDNSGLDYFHIQPMKEGDVCKRETMEYPNYLMTWKSLRCKVGVSG